MNKYFKISKSNFNESDKSENNQVNSKTDNDNDDSIF